MKHSLKLVRAAALVAIVGTAACSDRTTTGSASAPASATDVVLNVSSAAARKGERVAIDIGIAGRGGRVDAQDGVLTYNAAALRYVGQSARANAMFVVNATLPGRIRTASTAIDGLNGSAGTVVFEVLDASYLQGLSYRLDAASAYVDGKLTTYPRSESSSLAIAGTVPADARAMDMQDYLLAAYESDAAAGRKATRPEVALRPGGYRTNLEYGDANSDGSVNSSDASAVLFAAVGLSEIIATADTSFDIVVAGNVAPLTPPLGLEPDGTRIINSTDASLILNDAVLSNVPEIGDGVVIPGRAASDAATSALPGDTLTGNVTTSRTLLAGRTYILDGIVRVNSGATLTIQAGTRVLGRTAAGVVSALFIERTGRIDAQGTQLQPVIFSCTGAQVPGCWGGLFIAGNAPTNQQNRNLVPNDSVLSPEIPGRTNAGCLVNRGEGDAPLFGGCNPDDNSGTLRYVIVEFGGALFSPNNELNNLTMSGVGRGTTIEYVQVRHGLDDGFEWFGGTVDGRYLMATGNSDDQFDYSQGWSGRVQFAIGQMFPQDGEKGFEVDNHEVVAQEPNAQPFGTYGEFWNVTMVGKLPTEPIGPVAGNSVNDAVHIRRGAKTQIGNMIVFSFPVALDLDNTATCETDTRNGNALTTNIRNSWFGGNTVTGNTDGSDPAGCGTEDAFIGGAGRNNTVAAAGANPFRTVGGISAAMDLGVADFRLTAAIGTAGTPASRFLSLTPLAVAGYTFTPTGGTLQTVPAATGGVGAFAAGGPLAIPGAAWTRPEHFDATATYVGAVDPALTANSIPWYSGWTRSGRR